MLTVNHFNLRRLGVYRAALAIAASAGVAVAQSAPKALVTQYCVGCHNQKNQTAGVALDSVDWANPGASANILEKVLRKVRTGEMPPVGLPHPAAAASTAFTAFVETSLDREATTHPNPGRPAIQRLNRAECSNAIRDLLALRVTP